MNDRLKKALSKVQTEEELKNSTKEFLYKKTKGYVTAKTMNYRLLLPAIACFLLVLFGGHWLYFTPTVEISIDVNPSIELGVNRFDKIISVHSYNSDGQELADSLDIKYMDYTDALNQILMSENVCALLSNNEIMMIGVIGSDDVQSTKVLSEIESCTDGETNTYCYYANSDEVKEAHEMGLSYGKYRAYLELQTFDSTITAEEVQKMTMREIQNLIDNLSGDHNSGADSENGNGHSGSGAGNGFGQGQKNGYGANGQSDSQGNRASQRPR